MSRGLAEAIQYAMDFGGIGAVIRAARQVAKEADNRADSAGLVPVAQTALRQDAANWKRFADLLEDAATDGG